MDLRGLVALGACIDYCIGLAMMTRRTLISAGVVAVAIAITWWWTRRSHDKPAPALVVSANRSATIPGLVNRDRSGALPVAPGAASDAVAANSKSVTIPVTDVDVEQDRIMRAQHELTYRIARLRFLLADAAAPCYHGGPSDEKISVAYTIVVHNDELRIENLRVSESSIRDSAVQACLIGAVRDLRTLAPNIGELRQENQSWIALSDLADSNRRFQRGSDDGE